jgi:hypothetical protein
MSLRACPSRGGSKAKRNSGKRAREVKGKLCAFANEGGNPEKQLAAVCNDGAKSCVIFGPDARRVLAPGI